VGFAAKAKVMCSSQGGETKATGEVPLEAENSHPSSGILRLFCLVEGDDSVFLVDTGDCYIADFKENVHKKKDKTILRDVNASDLTVLKVRIYSEGKDCGRPRHLLSGL